MGARWWLNLGMIKYEMIIDKEDGTAVTYNGDDFHGLKYLRPH